MSYERSEYHSEFHEGRLVLVLDRRYVLSDQDVEAERLALKKREFKLRITPIAKLLEARREEIAQSKAKRTELKYVSDVKCWAVAYLDRHSRETVSWPGALDGTTAMIRGAL